MSHNNVESSKSLGAVYENRDVFKTSFPIDVFVSDNYSSPINVVSHWHNFCEILLVLEGNASQQFFNKHFQIHKNDLIILNSGDVHSFKCNFNENTKILVLQFMPEYIYSNYFNSFQSTYIIPFINSSKDRIFHLQEDSNSSQIIRNLMLLIHQEYQKKDPYYEIIIKGFLYQLIGTLIRNSILNSTSTVSQEKKLNQLEGVLSYIESNFFENITLTKAANLANMSYSYFSRFFRRSTGKNFTEYLDYVRICEAEKLLMSSDINISTAALEVGFSSASSFNKVYKKIRGFTPKCFKRTNPDNI